MHFTYVAKIKPYVRMTQKGKWVDPQAREYMVSKNELAYALRVQMLRAGHAEIPAKTPFAISLTYQAPNVFQFDLDNLLKAVMDAAQGIVFPDDRWCTDVRRLTKQRGPYALIFEVVLADQESKPILPVYVIPPRSFLRSPERITP